MSRRRGFTIIELLVVVAILGILAGLLLPTLMSARQNAKQSKCMNNLKQIGEAMSIYVTRWGGQSTLPVPASQFRGDTWVCSLYWLGLLTDSRALICPSTADSPEGIAPPIATSGWTYPIFASDFAAADALLPTQMSYCGRTNMDGLSTATATLVEDFTDKQLGRWPLACDKPGNHDGAISVVLGDGHTERLMDAKDFVGKGPRSGTGDPTQASLQYMDSGD